MSFTGHNYNDRLKEQKEARLAMLERAKAKKLDPEAHAKKMEERARINEARTKREAEKEIQRIEDDKRIVAEKTEAERKTRLAAAAQKKAEAELVTAQKARRDARYAARKAKR